MGKLTCGCVGILGIAFVIVGIWAWLFMAAINFVFPALALSYWQAFVLWLIIAAIMNLARSKK